MAAERKEKSIRVLQIMETTDEKSPLNANQIVDEYFAPAEPPVRFIAPPVRGMDPLES